MVTDVLGEIARQLAAGFAIGCPAAWLIVRGFEGVFFGVRATDPLTYAIVGAGLIVIGFTAASVPARRASRVDPLISLRSE
jgi:putative ABC transport system permease protein